MSICIDCGETVAVGPRCGRCAALRRFGLESKLPQVMQRLYDSEINGSLRWFWDGGFEWTIYGKDGGSGSTQTWAEAVTAMAETAVRMHPDGAFAKWWKT